MFFPKFPSKNCTQERVILAHLCIYVILTNKITTRWRQSEAQALFPVTKPHRNRKHNNNDHNQKGHSKYEFMLRLDVFCVLFDCCHHIFRCLIMLGLIFLDDF